MQVKMQDLLGFSQFYEMTKNHKLPIKTAYRLAQLAHAIDSAMQFYREKLQTIINTYGELDENNHFITTNDGNGIKLRQGMESNCYAEIHDLQELEVELPDITFSINDFDNIELTAEEVSAIVPFIAD